MTRFAQRRARAAGIAQAAGLDALAFVPGPNFHYLTGLRFHLMERPTVMVITAAGEVAAVMPALERSKWHAAFPEAETFYWQDSDGYADAFARLGALLPGTVGVEGMRMRMFESAALARHCTVEDAEPHLSRLRIAKDASEVAALRRAIEISETALEELIATAQVGDTEAGLAARLKQVMLHHGAEGFAFDPLVLSGPNAADCHGTPGDRALAPGDVLLIDFGARYDAMNADITRSFFCQHATDAALHIHDTVRAANAHGRACAAPGVTCDTLDRETTEVLRAAGHSDLIVHKTGHGLGLDVHEAPQVMLGNATPLEPGMVITVEPGLYRPGDLGIRIEDDVLITETAAESLTSFPREARCFG